MAPIGTLWGMLSHGPTKVILSVAAVNGLELETPEWSFMKKPEEFLSKFTMKKIPAFEGKDGFKLIESSPIARYLCSLGPVDLLGSTPKEAAIVDQWIHFVEHEINIPAGNVQGTAWGHYYNFSSEILEKNYQRVICALDYLEKHFAARSSDYVALDTLTLADFVLVCAIRAAATAALGAAERAQYPLVFAHYDRLSADERFGKHWGRDEFVDVRITEARPYPPPWV